MDVAGFARPRVLLGERNISPVTCLSHACFADVTDALRSLSVMVFKAREERGAMLDH
jgi:hypothetical protein